MGGKCFRKINKESLKWYRYSAEEGDACAQNSKGYFYFSGEGDLEDYEESARYFRIATELEN
jgi:TPR repeat protein